MKCGFEYYRTQQHWYFHTFKTDDPMIQYANFLGIPPALMKHNGGAWFVDFTKPPNYEDLTLREREQLDLQVSLMIEKKYEFLHFRIFELWP